MRLDSVSDGLVAAVRRLRAVSAALGFEGWKCLNRFILNSSNKVELF